MLCLMTACGPDMQRFSPDLQQADSVCSQQLGNTTQRRLAECQGSAERAVWSKYEPGTIDIFEAWATARYQLSAKRDDRIISHEKFDAAIADLRQRFVQALRTRRQQFAEQRAIRAKENAEEGDRFARALLLGISAAAQARSDGDAAALRANKTQHTRCYTIGNDLNCDTQ